MSPNGNASVSGRLFSRQLKFLPKMFRALVLGYATFAVLCSFAAPVDKFDDPIPLVHGTLVQQGLTPSLDFYSFYPPLVPYLNAATFTLFGRTVMAVRIIAALLYFFVLLFVDRFFRSQFGPSAPLVSASVLLVATSIGAVITLPVWPGLALSLIALLTYLCAQKLERYRLWGIACAGLLTGLTLLCRINFGGYVLSVTGVDLLLRWWSDARPKWDCPRFKADLSTVSAFAIPLIASWAGFCYWVYGNRIDIGISEFVVTAQTVIALRFLHLFADWRIAAAIAFPTAWFLLRLMKAKDMWTSRALVVVAFSVGILAVAIVGHAHSSLIWILTVLVFGSVFILHVFVLRLEQVELSLLLFYCCLLHYFVSRADYFHARLLPIAAALMLPLLLISRRDSQQGHFVFPLSNGMTFAILTILMVAFSASSEFRPSPSYLFKGVALIANFVRHPQTEDAEVILREGPIPPEWESVYNDEDEWKTLRYLQARTSRAAPIFVGVRDHSTIFYNDLRLYWLSGRPIGVRTFQLETRMATESAVQREIIEDLDRNNVNWVILDGKPEWYDEGKPYKGSEILDKYIASKFSEEARFGYYAVLSRNAP